jgi:hypothetical protein
LLISRRDGPSLILNQNSLGWRNSYKPPPRASIFRRETRGFKFGAAGCRGEAPQSKCPSPFSILYQNCSRVPFLIFLNFIPKLVTDSCPSLLSRHLFPCVQACISRGAFGP